MISLLSSSPRSGAGTSPASACVATASPAAGRRGKWRGGGRRRRLNLVGEVKPDGGRRDRGVSGRECATADEISRTRHHQAEVCRIGAAVIARKGVGEFDGQRLAPIRA